MNDPEQQQQNDRSVVSVRTVEILVAVVFLFIAGVVIYDSTRIGFGWASDGPQAGYFPFYIGVLIAIASIANLVQVIFSPDLGRKAFVRREQFRSVLAVLIPMAIYIAAIYVVGIYVASVLFIAVFMRWLGRFGWTKIALVGLLVPFGLFLMFEVWFLVPLPKGPLEALFGF
ncbi:MAG TPA: tripartite tricarboxylate transporter TctB family protein [Candidatus Binatia bacterium]|nr:tripartite tricarboxylate transporter TctB family protein [Candidatus Binatia bacterium]